MKDKRLEKVNKHYNVLIDGKSFKVMNYIISNDNQTLRLITKIRGQKFPDESIVVIEIPTSENNKIVLKGNWKGLLSKPALEEWEYEIIK